MDEITKMKTLNRLVGLVPSSISEFYWFSAVGYEDFLMTNGQETSLYHGLMNMNIEIEEYYIDICKDGIYFQIVEPNTYSYKIMEWKDLDKNLKIGGEDTQ